MARTGIHRDEDFSQQRRALTPGTRPALDLLTAILKTAKGSCQSSAGTGYRLLRQAAAHNCGHLHFLTCTRTYRSAISHTELPKAVLSCLSSTDRSSTQEQVEPITKSVYSTSRVQLSTWSVPQHLDLSTIRLHAYARAHNRQKHQNQ